MSTVAERPNSGKPDKPVDRVLAVLALQGLTYREKVVLVAVATFDGKRGAFPSLDTLAGVSSIKRWAVAEAIKALEAKGAIKRQRTQRSNRYAIAYDFHSRENPDGGNSNPTVGENQFPPSGKPGLQSRENPDANREEQEGTGIGRSPPGERTPYPLEFTRASNSAPPASPACGQSVGAIASSEKTDCMQAVDFTPTMRPPERRSELDEMLDRYTELKDRLTDGELDADDRLALEAMLPGMETEIARLENGE